MNKKRKKPVKDINELTKGFEKLIEKDGYSKDGKGRFERTIKKINKGKK